MANTHARRRGLAPWLALGLAIGVWGAGTDARAESGELTTLTYNVAGLLEPFSSGDPAVNTPIISCLIRDYDLVHVQEDFNYHAALYDSCDDHPYRSPTSGGMGFGSGLNTLSDFPYTDWTRVTWSDCDGVDCLTPKGFTLARVRLREGVYVDVYNLHAQAETTSAALAARRANIRQLAAYIEAHSAGNAVIVLGDTNTRYTRSGDDIRALHRRGFRDVWVDALRGGSVPASGAAALTACEPDATRGDCELVDKILYRDNGFLGLEPTEYRVEDQVFVDAGGADLSDHLPVSARWSWATAPDRRLSDAFGGPHGRAFNDLAVLPAVPVVRRVSLRSGSRLDRVGLALSDATVIEHGGSGGSLRTLTLEPGESLRSVRLCSGQRDGRTRIFHASFTTSAGRTLSGGSTTGSCTTFSSPPGWSIVGFHGRAGDEVDKLGVIHAPLPAGAPPGPPPSFQIVNRASGLCLDIWNVAMQDGTNVAQWHCNGGDWQRWRHDPHTGLVRSQRDPRFCLDNSGSFENGANVMLWTCTGNANQRFDLDVAAGTLRMRTHPAQVVDGAGTAPGDDVLTWGDWGGANQRWDFVP